MNDWIKYLSKKSKASFETVIKAAEMFRGHGPIINSMLDDDLYKFTQQMAALELFPNEEAEYHFCNRGKQRFSQEFLNALIEQINVYLPMLQVTDWEIEEFKKRAPYLKSWYFEYLRNYRYNPKQVKVWLDEEKNLHVIIKGKWCETILWEVKIMAIISELYFQIIDTNWNMDSQKEKALANADLLASENCIYTEFGTRRRRSFETQKNVVLAMNGHPGFVGTSNVHLSLVNDLIPKGTQAHEWYMAMQVLEGIRNSNYYGLNNWTKVYNGDLGTALTDTLGTKQFLKNFNLRFAKLYDGVRHDSGDEIWFTDLIVAHYKSLKIDPMTKSIIFSNALDCERAINIKKYCEGKIKCSFGIGTFFTNSFEGSPALNMVIKMWSMNGVPVVKLSDDEGKIMGDKDAIRVIRWECYSTPLDD